LLDLQFRVQLSTAKNELNKAMRVIAKEIGEDVNVDKVAFPALTIDLTGRGQVEGPRAAN